MLALQHASPDRNHLDARSRLSNVACLRGNHVPYSLVDLPSADIAAPAPK